MDRWTQPTAHMHRLSDCLTLPLALVPGRRVSFKSSVCIAVLQCLGSVSFVFLLTVRLCRRYQLHTSRVNRKKTKKTNPTTLQWVWLRSLLEIVSALVLVSLLVGAAACATYSRRRLSCGSPLHGHVVKVCCFFSLTVCCVDKSNHAVNQKKTTKTIASVNQDLWL